MKHRRAISGFTLMELVLVLVIIACLATLAAPALRAFAHARSLPNTAQDLISTLDFCRVQAISDGVTYRLYLDPDNSTWMIAKDDGTGTNTFAQINSAVIPTLYHLPADVTMETTMLPRQPDSMRYISFDPGGHAEVTMIALKTDTGEVDISCDAPLAPYRVVGTTGGS